VSTAKSGSGTVRCRGGFTPPYGEVNSPLRDQTVPLPEKRVRDKRGIVRVSSTLRVVGRSNHSTTGPRNQLPLPEIHFNAQPVEVKRDSPEVLMPHRKRASGTSFRRGRGAARRAFDTPASRKFMNCSAAQGAARPSYSTTHVVNPLPRRTSSSAGFDCRRARSQERERRPTTIV